jgi:hypothetical protein
MSDYTILIQVDPHTREFQYTDQNTNDDVDTIVLVNGDRVVWVLDPSIPERTFQIDFDTLNPFHVGTALSFRGSEFVVSQEVRLPTGYQHNASFKYSVSLGNGWFDDPRCLVVPEPPDPPPSGVTLQALTKSPSTITYNITWTDASETAVTLAPATDQSVVASKTSLKATVLWQWNPSQLDNQPFTLRFTNPPSGWPQGPISDSQQISLNLPAGAKTAFRIDTTTPAQVQKYSAGFLTVTAPA